MWASPVGGVSCSPPEHRQDTCVLCRCVHACVCLAMWRAEAPGSLHTGQLTTLQPDIQKGRSAAPFFNELVPESLREGPGEHLPFCQKEQQLM